MSFDGNKPAPTTKKKKKYCCKKLNQYQRNTKPSKKETQNIIPPFCKFIFAWTLSPLDLPICTTLTQLSKICFLPYPIQPEAP